MVRGQAVPLLAGQRLRAASERMGAAARRDGGGVPRERRAAATSAPTRRPRTSARRRARIPIADRKGPIKERPVSRLYENDEDWRNEGKEDDVEIDDIATSAKDDADADDE